MAGRMTGATMAPALFKEGKTPLFRPSMRCTPGARGISAREESAPSPGRGHQVPISHESRYFFCSGVRRSILVPMAASFSLAISRSITSGIG